MSLYLKKNNNYLSGIWTPWHKEQFLFLWTFSCTLALMHVFKIEKTISGKKILKENYCKLNSKWLFDRFKGDKAKFSHREKKPSKTGIILMINKLWIHKCFRLLFLAELFPKNEELNTLHLRLNESFLNIKELKGTRLFLF